MEQTAVKQVAAVKQTDRTQTRQNNRNTVFYAIGFMSQNLIWYMISTYLMLFYTDVVSLSAGAIAIIMVIARVWDAVNDPMMGVIVDRTKSRWGKFRPYIIIGPPFLAIFEILTFTVFPLEGVTKAVAAGITYILAGMAYTVVGVAINGLVNRLSTDSNVKMRIISIANIASNVVSTILAACAMPLILYFGHSDTANAQGFFWTTVLFSLISVPLFMICGFKCREVKVVELPKTKENNSVGKQLKYIFRNRPMMISIISTFIGAVGAMARMSLLSYYVIYVLGSYTMIAPIMTTLTVFQMIGNAFVSWGTGRFGKKNYMILMLVINAVTDILLFLNPHASIPFVIAMCVIGGFTQSGGTISYGMMYDSIDYGDYKYGFRSEGLSSSLMSFSIKLASALTGSVSVLLLSATGYVANQAQTPAAVNGINMIVNLIPALLQLVGIIPLIWYRLDKSKMDEIAAALKKRNESVKASE